MIKPDSNISRLLYNTIKIIAHDANGRGSSGTAFFFEFDADGYGDENCIPVLVTNKTVGSLLFQTNYDTTTRQNIDHDDCCAALREGIYTVRHDTIPSPLPI